MPSTSLVFESPEAVLEACRRDNKSLLIYENKILDVGKFSHPGPQALIANNIGKDITQAFNKQGHSDHAKVLCDRLIVGTLGKVVQGKLLPNPHGTSDLFSQEEQELHSRIDKLIDISKPLMPQVRKMTNREFKALISRPRYIEDEDGIQLFSDPKCDQARKRDFSFNIKVLIPVLCVFLFMSWVTAPSTWDFAFNMAVYFSSGVVILWTGIEYYFHRIVLHGELNLDPNAEADPDQLAKIFSAHTHHHVFMNQRFRIVLPLKETYLQQGGPGFLLACLVFSQEVVWPLFGGFLAGSVFYDAVHLACHFDDVLPRWLTSTRWFEARKSAHMRHHYRDNSKEFGVTAGLWDWVMGSM